MCPAGQARLFSGEEVCRGGQLQALGKEELIAGRKETCTFGSGLGGNG